MSAKWLHMKCLQNGVYVIWASMYMIKTLDRIMRLDFIGPITLSDIWQVLRQQSGRPTYQFSERYHHELNHIGSRLHETS